jgi:ATP-dependent RNA helicase DHX29
MKPTQATRPTWELAWVRHILALAVAIVLNPRCYAAIVDENRINYELIVDVLTMIASDSVEGAVLVFLPGLREIQTLVDELLRSPILGDADRCAVLPLHSSLSPQDQQKVFEPVSQGCRKIVVATNIAETSITIDDVVFVVDCGKAKINKYDPARRMASLVECWVSQASVKQRTGRAGRVRPGICFRLFSSRRHSGMDKFEVPEMLRAPLEGLVLQVCLTATSELVCGLG